MRCSKGDAEIRQWTYELRWSNEMLVDKSGDKVWMGLVHNIFVLSCDFNAVISYRQHLFAPLHVVQQNV